MQRILRRLGKKVLYLVSVKWGIWVQESSNLSTLCRLTIYNLDFRIFTYLRSTSNPSKGFPESLNLALKYKLFLAYLVRIHTFMK